MTIIEINCFLRTSFLTKKREALLLLKKKEKKLKHLLNKNNQYMMQIHHLNILSLKKMLLQTVIYIQ